MFQCPVMSCRSNGSTAKGQYCLTLLARSMPVNLCRGVEMVTRAIRSEAESVGGLMAAEDTATM